MAMLGPASAIDASISPGRDTGLAVQLTTQLLDALAERRPVDDLPAARGGADEQGPVALRACRHEPMEDAVCLAIGMAAAVEGALETAHRPGLGTPMLRATALQAQDLAVGATHGALGGLLPLADGGCLRAEAACLGRLRGGGCLPGEEQDADETGSQEPPEGLPVWTRTCGFDHAAMLLSDGAARHHPTVRVRRGTFAATQSEPTDASGMSQPGGVLARRRLAP
jgi:hypothetical protein